MSFQGLVHVAHMSRAGFLPHGGAFLGALEGAGLQT